MSIERLPPLPAAVAHVEEALAHLALASEAIADHAFPSHTARLLGHNACEDIAQARSILLGALRQIEHLRQAAD